MASFVLTLLLCLHAQAAQATVAEHHKAAESARATCDKAFEAYTSLADGTNTRRKSIWEQMTGPHRDAITKLDLPVWVGVNDGAHGRKAAAKYIDIADSSRAKGDEYMKAGKFAVAPTFYQIASECYLKVKEAADGGAEGYGKARAALKPIIDILCEYK
jgi:hypothetical protein